MDADYDMTKIQYEWVRDILYRIEQVIISSRYTEEEKIVAIRWLVKQAFKVDRDD
jgi:hypothetical protein